MSLLIVGSVALDSVETPKGKSDNSLGGSATYFSLSAVHFTPVSLVAVVGEDFPEEYKKLFVDKGIDIDGLAFVAGKTFRWSGKYHGKMNEATTLQTQLNVFEKFNPTLPDSYKYKKWVFLGNIDPQLQLRVLDQIKNPTFVAMDTMNYWIEGSLDKLKSVLKRVDAIIINEAELNSLSGLTNLSEAVDKLISLGPQYAVIKRGEYGAVLSNGRDWFFVPAYPERSVMDPTGAGDSFAGGFMGFLARKNNFDWITLKKAMIYGTIMASFNITTFGPKRLLNVLPEEISNRFSSMTRFLCL